MKIFHLRGGGGGLTWNKSFHFFRILSKMSPSETSIINEFCFIFLEDHGDLNILQRIEIHAWTLILNGCLYLDWTSVLTKIMRNCWEFIFFSKWEYFFSKIFSFWENWEHFLYFSPNFPMIFVSVRLHYVFTKLFLTYLYIS